MFNVKVNLKSIEIKLYIYIFYSYINFQTIKHLSLPPTDTT